MESQNQHLNTIQDIRQMMERSGRFISLSGLSGIAAGCCALVGAWFAHSELTHPHARIETSYTEIRTAVHNSSLNFNDFLRDGLFQIAVATFIAAFTLAFIFTYINSRKHNTPVWGSAAKRLMINVCIPMITGGIFLLKLIEAGHYGFIAPGCLIFYGLALVNASKYTLGEVRYLGYAQIILGIINLWFIGYGLYFWAAGFGILHIVYGAIMWWKHERR